MLWIHGVHLGVHVHLVVHVSERVRVHVHVLVPHLLWSLAEHLLLSQGIVNLFIIRREGELVFLNENQELISFLCASSKLIEDWVARATSEPSVGFVKYLKKRMESVTDWLQLYIWRWPISVSSLILPLVLLLVLEEETLEVDHQQRGRRWPGRRWWRESGTASCWEESGELMQGWDVVSHEIFTDDVAIIIDWHQILINQTNVNVWGLLVTLATLSLDH